MGDRIIIIRDRQEKPPVDHSYEADVVRYNEKINRDLGVGWFRKNSGRD